MYKDYICVYKRLCLPCAHILTQASTVLLHYMRIQMKSYIG